MKENFLHFTTDEPCILSINGKNIGLIDNNTCMEIDVMTKTDNIYVGYNPISSNKNAIPYTFNLNTNNTPSTDNKNVKIIPFPNNNYDILMRPFFYYQMVESNVLFNGNIGKYFISIVSDTSTKIIIYSGISIIFSINTILLKAVNVKDVKSYIIIEGIVDDKTYYLLVIDTNDFSVIHNDITHSIDINKDNISIYKDLNSLCKHAKVTTLDLNSKKSNEYYVFKNDKPNTNINNILIPYAFLECIKISDENTAKSFLSSNLHNTNLIQFQNYFGNIEEIYLNRHKVNSYKINYTIKTDNWRNFNFLMDNNKIMDIEEIF